MYGFRTHTSIKTMLWGWLIPSLVHEAYLVVRENYPTPVFWVNGTSGLSEETHNARGGRAAHLRSEPKAPSWVPLTQALQLRDLSRSHLLPRGSPGPYTQSVGEGRFTGAAPYLQVKYLQGHPSSRAPWQLHHCSTPSPAGACFPPLPLVMRPGAAPANLLCVHLHLRDYFQDLRQTVNTVSLFYNSGTVYIYIHTYTYI